MDQRGICRHNRVLDSVSGMRKGERCGRKDGEGRRA